MAEVSLEQLFYKHRCLSSLSVLVCLLYAPVGVVVATLRFCICLQALFALYLLQNATALRTLVLRVMGAVLGIWVREDRQLPSSGGSNPQCGLLVANSVSWFDWLAVQMLEPCTMVCGAGVPAFFQSALRLCHLSSPAAVHSARQREGLLLLQPEGTPTNGTVALLRFNSKMLPAGLAVRPVAISVHRPCLFAVAVSTVDSSPLSDLLYFFFVPYTVFTLRFLPEAYDESPSALMEKARGSIAESLSLSLTEFSLADKTALLKQTALLKRDALRASGRSGPAHQTHADAELSQMVLKVKQVLPHVPLPAIRSDIASTRCIDRTIANFLDGVVSYVAEEPPASCVAGSASSPAPLFTGAAVFSRDSSQRHLSFQQRKQQLFAEARRRYIEKHNLHHLLSES